jgi:hypothetical protein
MVCGHKWREIANPSLVAAAFGFFSSPYATTQPSSTSLGLLAAGKFLVVRLSLHNTYNSQGGCMSRDLLLVTSDADLSSAARSTGARWITEVAPDPFTCKLTDASLADLGRFPDMVRLSLAGTGVTDAGLEQIGKLTTLQVLRLEGTRTGDTGVGHLEGLTGLVELYLNDTDVTDDGMLSVGLLTSLQVLSLSATCLGNDALENIEDLRDLRKLWLRSTNVNSLGLDRLRRFRKITDLDLSWTKVGDNGMRRVARFVRELEWLDLSHTRVSDTGLVPLKALLKLKKLLTEATHVTNAGRQQLAAELGLADLNG